MSEHFSFLVHQNVSVSWLQGPNNMAFRKWEQILPLTCEKSNEKVLPGRTRIGSKNTILVCTKLYKYEP
jgi:hypothetical protein